MTIPVPITPLQLILGALSIWTASALIAVSFGKKLGHTTFSVLLFVGSLLLLAGAINGFNGSILWQAPLPFNFGVAPWLNRLDALSATFIGIHGFVGAAAALFSPGYLSHLGSRISPGSYWACLFLFMVSMAQVILSGNVLTFLVFWEVMSLSSLALVATDHGNHRVQKASLIYLGATRVATAFLAGGFLWIFLATRTWTFSEWHLQGHQFLMPVLLVLIGLCTKAGIFPFHSWLPYAHPAAPTPVSALMSGVMIKVAIYAIIRLIVFNDVDVPAIPYILLFLGTASAFWGVLFALKEQDFKSLLAYSSIENVGLILMGIAVCLYCRDFNFPQMAAIALAAALFQCVNHAVFKSLLFFGAGAIDSATGTRDMGVMGGLVKTMPYTSACFLIGSTAICALPPLNGFASKWLLYQSLFSLVWHAGSVVNRAVGLTCIGTLALVSGLAIACFTKAVGISCLGRARSHAVEHAHEVSRGMLAAQFFLAACCVILGVSVPLVLKALQPLCSQISSSPVDVTHAFTIPQDLVTIALVCTFTLIYMVVLGGSKTTIKKYITWECGYGKLSSRTEATAASFAQPIERIFRGVLQFEFALKILGRDRRHFPESITVETSTGQLLESSLYAPVIEAIQWLSRRFATLQAGSIHLYLLYMLITLILFVAIGEKL